MNPKNALDIILQNTKKQEKTEIIFIQDSLNRVLAKDFTAKLNSPRFNNSALDGYAFNYEDKDHPLKIVGASFAGDKEQKIGKFECMKIMTGAIYPQGSDTTLQVEDANFDENGNLLIKKDIKKYNACKFAGEEFKTGDLLLKKGEILNSAKIMLIASQGIDKIEVLKLPKIAIFSTGNEIKNLGENLSSTEIYDANSYGIMAIFAKFGIICDYKGIIKDDLTSIKEAIKKCEEYDFIITSGGASKGEADFMSKAFLELSYEKIIDGVKVKPGKMNKIFKKDEKLAFVLPGNPGSAYLVSMFFVMEAIAKFCGFDLEEPQIAILSEDVKLNENRANFIFGTLKDGIFYPFNKIFSYQITNLSSQNAVALIESGISKLNKNSEILIKKMY